MKKCPGRTEDVRPLYQFSADQGYVPAMDNLARCYEQGIGSVIEGQASAGDLHKAKVIRGQEDDTPSQKAGFGLSQSAADAVVQEVVDVVQNVRQSFEC